MSTKKYHIVNPELEITAALLVISDSLSREKKWRNKDKSARIAEELLTNAGITVEEISVVPDEIINIQSFVNQAIDQKIGLIITIGGTGISKRDMTIEAIHPLIQKTLPGFGELFRKKTFEKIGAVAIMTRTMAGVKEESCIVCLPGSPKAVDMGVKLILKEILHILNLRRG